MCVSRAVGSRTSPQIVTVQLDPLPQITHMTNNGYGFSVILYTIIYMFTHLQSYSTLFDEISVHVKDEVTTR